MPRLSLPATLAAIALLAAAVPAAARPAGCPDGFTCTTVTVPLDRSGAVAGAVDLHVARERASAGPGKPLLIALNGGPGTEGVSWGPDYAEWFAPALRRYQLVVMDTRGTGRSDPIDCPRAQHLTATASTAATLAATAACGARLGARAGLYGTAATVEDIDAVRRALGADRIALYGVSYGSHVVERYALAHPDRLERAVLDSPVEPGSRNALQLAVFAAMRRILDDLDPRAMGETAALARRLERRPLRGRIYDGRGRERRLRLSQGAALADILIAGDSSSFMRSQYPAAVRAALRGRPRALLRLDAILTASPPSRVDEHSEGLYDATTCTDIVYPWAQSSDPATRGPSYAAMLRRLRPEQTAPFDARTVGAASYALTCRAWPAIATGPDRAPGAYPAIPTLILVGLSDLRTPLEAAQAQRAVWPNAGLVTARGAGHAVVGFDTGGCAEDAVNGFLLGAAPADRRCTAAAPLDHALKAYPTRIGQVAPAGGRGRAAHAFGAVLATWRDAKGTVDELASRPGRFGGLRGGTVRWARRGGVLTVWLRDYRYLPGVRVSGRMRDDGALRGRLVVRGRVHGTIVRRGERWVGRFAQRRLVARGDRLPATWPMSTAAATTR